MPVSVDASCAFTSTHGSYDTGVALADGEGDVGVGEPVLAVVVEPHADATESRTHIDTNVSLRNMRVISF
jgi:hypothetical protein